MSKKLVSAALMASTLMWAVGVAALPVASAQTATSTQAQITALLAQIAQLQAQLGSSSSSSSTTTSSSYSFTKDLTLGSSGADVTALQQMLIGGGYLTAVTAPTGYFGTLTQAALAKYQTAMGITPAAGYFGPKTRAYLASHAVGTTSTTTTTTSNNGGTTTTTTGTQTTTGVNAPATGLLVGLAATNPVTGSLISSQGSGAGAARVPVLSVNFTAGTSGAVTVSEVKFHKVGVLSDSSVSGAYLTQNGKVLYQYNSLNQGVLDFSGMSLNIPAGQTVTLTLAIDVSGGLSAGNTTSFSLNSASDVSSFDVSNNALTPSGSFPVNGNMFTVTNVSNPSLATVAIAGNSVGNQVTAGTQNDLVAAWNFTVQNSKVYLNGINLHVIGSANKGDIRNVKLMINGTQVGATLPTVGQDGTAYFNASATPGVLNTGSNNVQVFADVMGSPSYNFQFEILNGYDVLALDSQYNVPVSVGNAAGALITMTGSSVTIQQGQITVTQDANTPTGNIAKGQSQVTIAKFDIYAAGEAVKVKYLPFSLTFTGAGVSTALSSEIQNVAIVDDAGGQVGTTINQPVSSNGTYVVATGVYTDSFGTSGSPINYTVPANTTRVLSLKADIQSTADFTTVTGAILPGSSNLQGMISSQIGSTSGANGSALSLAQYSLTVAQNNALGTQKVAAGVQGLKIGSYALTASSAEGVNVNNVSVQMGGSVLAASKSFQNLKLMIGTTQFGTSYGTLNDTGIYTFSGTPFNVPAGNTVNVDVYADTLSSATSTNADITPASYLSSLSGTGASSNSAISLTSGSVAGQSLTFAGATTLSVAADSSQPAAATLTMGSSNNQLAAFRFQETGNTEDVKITDLNVTDVANTTSSLAAFNTLTLYDGSTPLGTAGSAVGGTTTTVSNSPYFASSTLTVGGTLSATGTYQYTVTLNGISSPWQNVTLASSTTFTTDLATAIRAMLSANTGAFGTSFSVSGSGANVIITSTGYVSMNASASVFGQAGITFTPVNNAGLAPTFTTHASNSGTYVYSFHFANPIIVKQSNTKTITLTGNVASYSSNGATDNSLHVFKIAQPTDVTALGATSNLKTVVSGTAASNSQLVLRSTLTVAATANANSNTLQDLGEITLTANNQGPVMLNNLNLSFSDSNASGTSMQSFLNTVVLKNSSVDVSTSSANSGLGAMVGITSSTTSGVVTWNFATTTVAGTSSTLVVAPGSPVVLHLWGDPSKFPSLANISSQQLTAQIKATTDVQYYDNSDSPVSGGVIPLPVTNPVPLTVFTYQF